MVSPEDVWKLVTDQGLATEVSVTYQVRQTDSTPADVAAGLAASLNTSPEAGAMGYRALSSDATVVIIRADGVAFTLSGDFSDAGNGNATIEGSFNLNMAEATAKLSGAVVADDIWKLVIDQGLATEVSVIYQVQQTDSTLAVVAAGLAAALNTSEDPEAVGYAASSSGDTVVIDKRNGVVFSLSGDFTETENGSAAIEDCDDRYVLELVSGGGTLEPNLVYTRTGPSAVEASVPANDRQQIQISRDVVEAQFSYGDNTVTVALDGTAATLEAALETLDDITDAAVVAGKTAADPWEIVLLDAATEDGAYLSLKYAVTKERGPVQLADNSADPTDNTQQRIGAGEATVWYGAGRVDLDAGMDANDVADTLAAFDGLRYADVTVSEEGSFWLVTLAPKDGGTPRYEQFSFAMIETVAAPTEQEARSVTTANRVQELVAGGPLTLWYGDRGVDVVDVVYDAEEGLTDIDIKAALESLQEVDRVEVSGAGTESDPWKIVMVDAGQAEEGDFLDLRSERYDANGAPLQQSDSAVKRQARDAAIATQAFFLEDWQDHALIHYGDARVEITRDMAAADVAGALESLTTVREVWVSGAGTATDPWTVVFLDADLDADGVHYQMAREVQAQRMIREMDVAASYNLQQQWIPTTAIVAGTMITYGGTDVTLGVEDIDNTDTEAQAARLQAKLLTIADLAGVTVSYDAVRSAYQVSFPETTAATQALVYDAGSGAEQAELEQETNGSIVVPVGITNAAFYYQATSVAVDLSLGADSIGASLHSLGAGTGVTVAGSGMPNDPWDITIAGYDPNNAVTVEYTGGVFEALAAGGGASYQVIERLSADDEWAIELDASLDYAVYPSAADTAGSEMYISAYQTVEREVPRLVEKTVWEDLNGDGQVEETDKTDWFEDPTWVNDHRVDSVTISGSSVGDSFLVGHEVLNAGTQTEEKHTDTVQVTHQRLNGDVPDTSRTVVITLRGLDLDDAEGSVVHDQVTVDALAGNDRIIAGFTPNSTEITASQILTARAVDQLTLIGGPGDDRIVGTPYADRIISGDGDDTVTGYGGVDAFVDTSGTDTLIEARDLNFSLTDGELATTGQQQSPVDPAALESVSELEGISSFERFELFGGAHGNSFSVANFTKIAHLDGTEGGDTYVLTLTGPLSGQSSVYVTDSGTGSTDSDRVEIWGGDVADTLHLDADASVQELERKQAGDFQLTYNGQSTEAITDDDGAEEIAAKLEALDSLSDIDVTGSGTAADPWRLTILSADANDEGKFFRLYSSDDTVAQVRVARATVTRVGAHLADALLAGRPDLDAMFERPSNETQVFYCYGGAVGTFRLQYNGHWTDELSKSSSVSDMEQALELLPGITDVKVTGEGTSKNPWMVKILEGDKDSKGDYYLLQVDNADLASPPADLGDAAATTRPSISLACPADYLRVYYDFSAADVMIPGGGGSDTFIADDSIAAM